MAYNNLGFFSPMNLYSDAGLLEGYIRTLSGKNDSDKAKAAKCIKTHVDAAARELSLERFEYFERELFTRIFALILSDQNHEKIGGILVVNELISATSASTENKISRISDTLSEALRTNTEYSLLELISDALGKLAKAAIVSHSDSIERQLFTGLDWLKNSQAHRRFAACHLLKNLVQYAPTVFFAKLQDFFEHIWGALWDSKERIRLVASDSISACLVILADRTYNAQWYAFIYNQVHEGFKKGLPESCHGSLLVTEELLKHTGDFMVPKFKEICKSIIQLRDKTRSIKSAILSLIPQLASYCPDIFANIFLDDCMEILMKYFKVADLKAETLVATGKLCIGLGTRIADKIEDLLELAKDALTQGGRKARQEIAPEAVRCVSDMVLGMSSDRNRSQESSLSMQASGQLPMRKREISPSPCDDLLSRRLDFADDGPSAFQDKVLALLEPMLQTGLTQELIHALIVITERIPSQRFIIKEKLVEEVIKILGGTGKTQVLEPDFYFSWTKKGSRYGVVSRLKSGGDLYPASTSGMGMRKNSSSSNLSAIARPLSPPIPNASSSAFTANAAAKNNSNSKKGFSIMSFISGGKGTSSSAAAPDLGANDRNADVDAVVNSSTALVVLALKTLSSLQPPTTILISLLQGSVLPYFQSDEKDVRKEAVVSCANILSSSGFLNLTKGPSSKATEDVIARLIEVMVSDPDLGVRLALIQSLPNSFDGYLSRQHHIESVTLLLADESMDMRLAALHMISRLSIVNPSAVLPHLRSLLIRFISELKNSFDCRLKEETALMVCNFVRAMPLHQVVKAYLNPIVHSLSFGYDVRLTTACLEAFGEICIVMRGDSVGNVRQLMPIVINNIRDSTSRKKQETALRTLGQMINASGLVIVPYLQFPQLLPTILELLYKTSLKVPWSLRREVLRTLGIIGALEPRRFERIVSHLIILTKGDSAQSIPSDISLDLLSAVVSPNKDSQANPPIHPNPNFLLSGSHTLKPRDRSDSSASGASQNRRDRSDSFISAVSNTNSDSAKSDLKSPGLIQSDTLLEQDNTDLPSHLYMYELSVMRSWREVDAQEHPRLLPTNENYYSHVVVNALVKILKDESTNFHHSTAAAAVVSIFRSLEIKSNQYIDQVLPHFLKMIRRSSSGLQESLLQHISSIISICHNCIAAYLPTIFEIIVDFWRDQLDLVLHLAQEIATHAPDLFAEYVPKILPMLLSSLSVPSEIPATIKQNTQLLKPLEQVLVCCNVLRVVLRPYIHLVVPSLCKIIFQLGELGVESTHKWLTLAIKTLRNLATSTTGSTVEQISNVIVRIVHTLTSTITLCLESGVSTQSSIYVECISTLCAVGRQVGTKFITFDTSIRRVIEGRGLDITQYSRFSVDLRSGVISDYSYNDGESAYSGYHDNVGGNSSHNMNALRGHRGLEGEIIGIKSNKQGTSQGSNAPAKTQINQAQLSRAWDVSQRTTANDWHEWLRRLKIELIRESPVPAIKACAQLSQSYLPLAHDLFHAAFVSCWSELNELYQAQLVLALHTAFKSSVVPPEILQTLLNLAEFMEHDVEAFPISLSILAELAQKSHAYAKALHYRECEFEKSPETCFESLININKKLDQYDAAAGILKHVTNIAKCRPTLNSALSSKEAWLSKLGYWEEALASYEHRLKENEKDSLAIWGQMKCLEALGRWEDAINICNDHLSQLRIESQAKGDNIHTKAAVIGARAAWSLQQWAQMGDFISQLPDTNVEGSLMKAVLAVHNDNFDEAETWIENTRKQLDISISALLAESYSRAYVPLITVQQCSELEEVIQYKKLLLEGKILGSDLSFNQYRMNSSMYGKEAKAPLRCFPKRNQQFKLDLLGDLAAFDPNESRHPQYVASHLNTDAIAHQISNHKEGLAEKWRLRLKGSCGNSKAAIHFSKYLINGHNLVFNICEDLESRLEFVTLCRKNNNFALASRALGFCQRAIKSELTNESPQEIQSMNMKTSFAALKLQWDMGQRNESLLSLRNLIKTFSPTKSADSALYVRILLKLGQWRLAMIDPGVPVDSSARGEVTSLYNEATTKYGGGYRAWHLWGLSNYRAIEETRNYPQRRNSNRSSAVGNMKDAKPTTGKGSISTVLPQIVNAITGLLKAISIGTRRHTSSVTQDLLCVLSLWFKHGHNSEVLSALEVGMQDVHVDNWLGVIPQLIARIDHNEPNSRQLLRNLLVKLSLRHTQALVFPLSVAISSPKQDRKDAAELLMSSLRSHNPKLIDQAVLVSRELVRVAIVWEELWHECLEEASRQYFGDGNIPGMIETLTSLHAALENASTIHEIAFRNAYGKDLRIAWDCIQECKAIMVRDNYVAPNPPEPPARKPEEEMTPMEKSINRAWKYYYIAFQLINKKLPLMLSLELPSISPLLNSATDMDLGIPGTYQVNGSAIKIKSFSATVAIIKSKQRPRKLKILGEDGYNYIFLLKGHEDLRQDERVMQLFGLVNALLALDRRSSVDVDALSIERYAVIPLSPTAGLISWVPKCDTMHDLIREYRENRRILLNVEHKLMQQLVIGANGYDILTYTQKLEVFEHALAGAAGEDLAKILWLKATNSESWLQRRSNYTRSFAVMSMVGYILGLGDRHPSNIMLLRESGKVLHIDFGDCFEVAMHREKFPEKVPFRLTRMLVKAMEISGIEGNFRLTCEKVLGVLREHNDSLVATLEAFVYDPLISWRLFTAAGGATKKSAKKQGPEFEKSNTTNANANVNKSNDNSSNNPNSTSSSAANSSNSTALNSSIMNNKKDAREIEDSSITKPVVTAASKLFTGVPSTTSPTPHKIALPISPIANAQHTGSGGGFGDNSNSKGGGSMAKLQTVVEGSYGEESTIKVLNYDIDSDNEHIDELVGDEIEQRNNNNSPYNSNREGNAAVSDDFTNLHDKIRDLADSISVSYHSLNKASFSIARASIRQMSVAITQNEVLSNQTSSDSTSDHLSEVGQQELNHKALTVIKRVTDKLTGLDFHDSAHYTAQPALRIPVQVDKLIEQAMAHENLCQSYVGWCPFW